MAATILGAAAAAFWFYLIALRGGFWRVTWRPAAAAAVPVRSVAVVVPARDEAAVIGPALSSLLAQRHDGPLHLIVVDDHSSDGTAAVARQTAQRCDGAERLNVIRSAPMPGGWTGKLWAMHQGIDFARHLEPDYLLLTDADIVHCPDNLRELVARAEGGYDLVSLMVRLSCRSRWERLLIPAFVFFFFKLYPPRWVADPGRRTAAAAGGCMLVRRDMLERIGGVEAIRRELIDDCALARRIKAGGGTVWLAVAMGEGRHATRSIREYPSWRPIWHMISRCAYAQLGYSPLALVATVAVMAVVYLAPPLLVVAGDGWPRIFGVAAWLAMSLAFLPILRSYRCPWRVAPLLPAIAAFYTAATIASAIQFWRGRGGQWKGRFQAAPIA